MPSYETLCILHPELPETRIKELTVWMQKILEGAQGTVVRVDEWGMRDLGFRLKKQRRGYYVRIEHESSPVALKELERNLRLSEDVLRFLSVRCTALPAPTPTPASSPAVSAAPPVEPSVEEQQ